MQEFLVHESNMERLCKKMESVQKKCEQTHCSFTFNPHKGVEYHTCKGEDGEEYTAKFFLVEVDGVAKYNGWRFVATLDHHKEGNVIRAFDTELAIPEKYKTCGPTCEHCNKIRSRKDTYLVYNDDTQEFKQVGKSCLQEFTNGLSAENIAFFCSIYEKVESYGGYSGASYNRYISVESILKYAFECYRHWGYHKADSVRPTRERVCDYYFINRYLSAARDAYKEEMREVGFDPESDYAVTSTANALEWIQNIDKKELVNDYLRNLHIICSEEYVDARSLGILVSLTSAYSRHIQKEEENREREATQKEEAATSDYVGNVGERLIVTCKPFAFVTSWHTIYGDTYLYRIKDEDGNIFIWYASRYIEDPERVLSIKGTVKEHSEYRGVKQTILTRCKVEEMRPEEEEEKDEIHDIEEVAANTDLDDAFKVLFGEEE